jgi:hypothetical protein
MTKTRAIKKQIITFREKYILWTVILILIILQGISAWQIIKLREYADTTSNLSMRFLLKNAEEERYKHPIIDIAENRVYIPEARIYLPLNEASRNLRYDYRERGGGFWSKALYFSTSSIVGRQSEAKYESCDKMVTLAPSEDVKINNDKPVGSIESTKDGLSDIYTHPVDICWDQKWYTDAKQGLVNVVKEAKNY